MEQRIKERFNESILDEVMTRYGTDRDSILLLDGFESIIYQVKRHDGNFILRIGHDLRRHQNLVMGEVDWINFLASGGVSVARAIESSWGHLVESIDDGHGGQFVATAFTQAPGKPPSKEEWNDALFRQYGRIIGQMHCLSRDYHPERPEWRRPHWDDPIMLDVTRWIPQAEQLVLDRYRSLKMELNDLPINHQNYGLIHQDAHAGNFFVDESGQITLFDFDDCVYGWYINDIAIALFYALVGREDAKVFAPRFLQPFLRGYQDESPLNSIDLELIPKFLKLREIDIYAVIHRSFDVDQIDNPWVAGFMKNRKSRIENAIPFVDYDFTKLPM